MPRIFKGIESELRLLLHPCILTGEITDIKVALFTNDPSVAIEFTDRYTIDDNILTLTVPTWAFGTMEDGVINYVIQGMHNDDAFITDRQSNYYLKTPTDYIPEEMPKEVVLGELTTKIVENGVFEYTPSDVDAWNKATIEVNVPDTNGAYDEGYNQGYEDGQNSVECPDCPEGGSCNLGEGEIYLTANDAGFYELYASDDGYDGWSKFYVTLENGGAIKIHKAEELIQMFNEGWGIDFGAYYYVGGEITEIQEINTEFGNATYVLDNGFTVYRGDWIDGNPFGEDQIKVGAYIVVYGIIQDYNGQLQFKAHSQVIAYQECEGGEIVSCNLEDKGVNPSINDRDGNGVIVITPSENYDGLLRVVLDPTTIYNEGVSAGKAEGGDLNIGTGDIYLTANERGQRFEILPSEFEYDAFDKFIVEMENFDLGGDTNIYDALSVNQLLMDGVISYNNNYIFKGEITEIQRTRPDVGDARYTLDGSLNVYNGQTMGYDLQVGDNVIVYGTLSEYNGAPQFSAGSEIKVWWREGGSCNLINPIIFSETEGDTINAESVQIPTFVYEGNQHYNIGVLYMADYDEFKIQIKFQPNNGGYEEPVNIFGCEDTGWDDTTFGARIYEGLIYFRMSGDDVAYSYSDYAWYDVEMGYNSSKRWIIVNGETLFETDHAFFNKPSQNFMIGAINSGGNAFRPFYGKIAATYIEANGNQVWLLPKEDGHMDVYWNSKDYPWVSISGENNARFESDWMSGDGMKSITWLGKKEAPTKEEVQGQVDQYTRPAVIFEGVTEVFVEEPHKLQTDDLVEATAWISTKDTVNNKWCLWTKEGKYEGVSVLNGSAFGGDYFEAKCIRLTGITKLFSATFFPISAEEIHFGNIEYIETSAIESMNELKKIFYTGDGNVTIDNNAIRGANPNGTLYLKNGVDETPWLERLPEGWVVERLNDDGSVNCGGADIEDYAKNEARVLNITENGVYTSQYTQDDDYNMAQYLSTGDNFKDYAFLRNSAYNTQVPVTIDSRLEFWFRPDMYAQTASLTIVIKNSNTTISQGFGIQQQTGGNGSYNATIGNSSVNFFLDDGKWYHIIMSITDGLIVNDEKIGEFNRGGSVNDVLYINSAPATKSFANGCFGMIKIDDTVIIPIENGFLNKTTNEIIPTYIEGLYEFYPLPITNKEGNLIRTVNVNVTPKISIALTGIKLGYSPFSEIPEYLDFKNVEDMYYMFFNCDKLTKVSHIDTSDVTNMSRAFYSCDALKEIELIDTSNVTNMEGMCYDCKSLITFPPLNTSKVTNMREMFRNCNNLVSVSALDARSLVGQSYGIFGNSNLTNLTDFGGLIGLKASMDGNYGFEKVPNLTYESCINILNGLYDFTGNGVTPTSNEGKLKVHSNFLTTVGDEISIGTAKGWVISA